jgi:hypothetical protein
MRRCGLSHQARVSPARREVSRLTVARRVDGDLRFFELTVPIFARTNRSLATPPDRRRLMDES